MRRREISIPGAILTVSEATALQGIRRGRLKYEAFTSEVDVDRQILRGGAYADCIAAVVAGDVPDFETFAELPESIANEWLEAVYDLNPHWNPANTPNEESAEKKVSTSDSG